MYCVNILLVAGELPLASQRGHRGSIAQLGEHLPYKQRVTGSSPVAPTKSEQVMLVPIFLCKKRSSEFHCSVFHSALFSVQPKGAVAK